MKKWRNGGRDAEMLHALTLLICVDFRNHISTLKKKNSTCYCVANQNKNKCPSRQKNVPSLIDHWIDVLIA